jgi:hypothetical protein
VLLGHQQAGNRLPVTGDQNGLGRLELADLLGDVGLGYFPCDGRHETDTRSASDGTDFG